MAGNPNENPLGIELRNLRCTSMDDGTPKPCALPACRELHAEVERLRALIAEIARTAGRTGVSIAIQRAQGEKIGLRLIATAPKLASEIEVARIAAKMLDAHMTALYEDMKEQESKT